MQLRLAEFLCLRRAIMRRFVQALSFSLVLLLPSVVSAQTHRGVTVGEWITPPDIEELARWNVNVVRYALVFNEASTADAATYNVRLGGALAHLDGLLPIFQQIGIAVIVNLYSPPAGYIGTTSSTIHRLSTDPWAQAA